MNREDYITTNEAADVLKVSRQRILQLIQDGRLKAEKFANVYMIRPGDLSNIEEKPMGRPPKAKARQANGKGGEKSPLPATPKFGDIGLQTKTTRKLNPKVKRTAEKRMRGGKKSGRK